MITFVLVALAAYFGFLIGRRYEEGAEEERKAVAAEAVESRGSVRLRSITIRR